MRDLSLHILDLVQNSIKANASMIEVHISAYTERNQLSIEISDNGYGMDSDFLKKVEDPFVTTRNTRKVGLGIPLLKESALKCEGNFNIYSKKNNGTKVTATFSINHIDRLPLGDIGDTMTLLISTNENIQFELTMESEKGYFNINTREINKQLNGISITEFEVVQWLKDYIAEGVNIIFGGVLNEVYS